ncbi:MAG: hypothetical protein JW783_10990 [Bacteroidales bacterium]|nr:hypothetical protein [Bacteroidales bacterium]MBN2749044.1 hypothetical protein [Bacteroidales bacterium]
MEKKIYLLNALGGLTPDNVSEVYAKEYAKWRVLNSSQVTINGDDVSSCSSLLKEVLMLPDENGNPNIEECTVNDKNKSGFYQDEQLFIDQQLAQYKPLLEKSKGSIINKNAHLKIKAYVKYLEDLSKPIEPLADRELLANLYQTYKNLFENESQNYWISRFIDDGKERKKLLFDPENKGLILVMLDTIQNTIEDKPKGFDYGKIIKRNFGFEYTKAKSNYRKKNSRQFSEFASELKKMMQ